MRFLPIEVDNTSRELAAYDIADFPLSTAEQQVSDAGCQVQHWHHEVQIACVTRGSARFLTPYGNYTLQQGEGIFLSSGVLHQILPTEDPNSLYICANFLPELIYGKSGSTIQRDYVNPVLDNPALQVLKLSDMESWQREILSILHRIVEIQDQQSYGFELMSQMLICQIWHLLLINNRNQTEKAAVVSLSDKQRIRLLKNFIAQNYAEKITLADIAAAGHICRSECCRFFKRVEHTTPIAYLNRYRIEESLALLSGTDLTITEIASQTGFDSNSYFCECFHKLLHCKPTEYRAKYNLNKFGDMETQQLSSGKSGSLNIINGGTKE